MAKRKKSRARQRGMRHTSGLQRRRPSREPRARILVVCVGAKTERTYFESLRDAKRLMTAEVEVQPRGGADPDRLVRFAEDMMEEATLEKLPYDEVWCVFDQDDYPAIAEACERASDLDINVALSNPCIEIWFLLHFEYSTAFRRARKAKSDLRKHIRGYDESTDVYPELAECQPTAIGNAQKLRKHHERVNEGRPENPSTDVDRLVVRLNELAEQQRRRR